MNWFLGEEVKTSRGVIAWLFALVMVVTFNSLVTCALIYTVGDSAKVMESLIQRHDARLVQLSADLALEMQDHLLLRNTELFKTIEKQSNNQPGGKK